MAGMTTSDMYSNTISYNTAGASDFTIGYSNIYPQYVVPQPGWITQEPTFVDPLGRSSRLETEKEWLRRRVREVMWARPA